MASWCVKVKLPSEPYSRLYEGIVARTGELANKEVLDLLGPERFQRLHLEATRMVNG